jgi:hypothetical protein
LQATSGNSQEKVRLCLLSFLSEKKKAPTTFGSGKNFQGTGFTFDFIASSAVTQVE